jgi:hypothetical protein
VILPFILVLRYQREVSVRQHGAVRVHPKRPRGAARGVVRPLTGLCRGGEQKPGAGFEHGGNAVNGGSLGVWRE